MRKKLGILVAAMSLVCISLSSAGAEQDDMDAKMLNLCEQEKNSTACFKVGDKKRTLDRDNKAALKYFLMSCEGGHMTGCNYAGILMQMSGKQYSPEWKQAAELFQKSCDAGEDGACFNMGSLKYKEGRAKAAVKYYQQACDMGNKMGCENVTWLNK